MKHAVKEETSPLWQIAKKIKAYARGRFGGRQQAKPMLEETKDIGRFVCRSRIAGERTLISTLTTEE